MYHLARFIDLYISPAEPSAIRPSSGSKSLMLYRRGNFKDWFTQWEEPRALKKYTSVTSNSVIVSAACCSLYTFLFHETTEVATYGISHSAADAFNGNNAFLDGGTWVDTH